MKRHRVGSTEIEYDAFTGEVWKSGRRAEVSLTEAETNVLDARVYTDGEIANMQRRIGLMTGGVKMSRNEIFVLENSLRSKLGGEVAPPRKMGPK